MFVGTGAGLDTDTTPLGWKVSPAADAIGVAASASSFELAKVVQGATSYQAIQVEGLDGDLVGIDGAVIHVKGVTALANTVTPGTATKLNWAGLGSAIPVAFSSDLTRSVSLHLSGALALSVAGVVAATTDAFTVDHVTSSGSDNAASDPITLSGADVWAFSLTNPSVFVGTGADLAADATSLGFHVVHASDAVGVGATASSFEFARIVAGSTSYTALQVGGLTGDLVGIDSVTVHLVGASALANSVSPAGTKLNWAGLDAGVVPFAFDAALTRNVSLHFSGGLALSIAGVVAATTSQFTVDHVTVSGSDHGSTPIVLSGADVWAFSLTNAAVFVGTGAGVTADASPLGWTVTTAPGAIGVSASASSFKLARAAAGTTSYVGLEVSGLGGDLVGIDGVTVHLSGGAALANSVTPAGAKLNWGGFDHGVLPFDFSSDLTSDINLHLSGGVALSVAGVVAATTTSFTLDHTTASGSDGNGITFTDADVWAFSLTNPSVFVGTGAELVADSSPLGFHVDHAVDAVGVGATASSFELARIAAGSTSYTALQVGGLTGDLIGIDSVTVHLVGASALANSVSPAGTKLDWAGLSPGVVPFAFDAALTGDVSLHFSGGLALSIAGVVAATTSQFTVDHVTVSGSDHGTTPIVLSGADVWAFSLTDPSLFVGTGAGIATDASPLGWTVTTAPGAVGVSASAASFKLARAAAGTTSYLGLEVTGLGGDLVGIDGATIHVNGATVLANSVTPAGAKLNWGGFDDGVLPFDFSSGLTSDVSLHLSGAVALSVAGVVAATTDAFTLDHTTASGSDGNGITLTGADVWAFSLTNPTVFVGTGAELVADTSPLGFHVDHASDAVGVGATASSFELARIAVGSTSYTGLQVGGLTGDLVGIASVTIHLVGASALANTVSPAGTKLNWAGLSSGVLPFGFPTGLTSDVSLHFSGGLALSIGGVVAATTSQFTVDHVTVSGSDHGTTPIVLSGADVWAFSLTNAAVFVGTGAGVAADASPLGWAITTAPGAVGVSASASSFKLARAAAGPTSYVGLEVSGLGGDLVGIDGATIHVNGATVLVNTVTPATSAKLNWGGFDHGVLPFDFSSALTSDVSLHISGAVALSVAGVVEATTDAFTLDHTTASGSDGHGITLTGADVWAFSLTNPTVFVGTGATLASDSGAASGYVISVGSGAVGLSSSATTFKLATIAQGTTTYTGIELDGLSGGLSGIPAATIHVSNVSALVNSVSPASAAKLNWATLSAGVIPFSFDTHLTRDVSLSLTGALSLSIAGLVQASTTSFAITHTTASGNDAGTPTITLTGADVWAVTLTGAQVFVGVGGSLDPGDYHVVNGTLGVAATASTFELATITQGTTTYTGLEVKGLSGSFIGVDGVTLTVDNVSAFVNSATPAAARKLDWRNLSAGVLPFAFDSDLSRAVSFKLAGHVTIDFAGVIGGDATFSATQQTADVTSPAITGASLFVFTLTSPSFHIGSSTFGLTLGGPAAKVTIAVLTSGTSSWTAVDASGFAGSLTLGTLVTATLANGAFSSNRATGTGATPLDWTKVVNPGTTTPATALTLSGPVSIAVSGTLASLNVAGFIGGSAQFSLTRQTVSATTTTGPVSGADLVLLTLSNLFLVVGSPSLGVTITSGSIALAALSADTRSWVGLTADDVAATLSVPGITGGVENLNVRLNEATNADPLDWSTVTPAPAGLPTTLSGAQLSAAGSIVDLNIFGLLTGAARFAIASRTVAADVDGTPGFSAATDLSNATLVTLWLSLDEVSGDPNVYSLAVGGPGFGLAIADGSVFVAALAPSAASDARRWIGVQASGLHASLTLPAVTAIVDAVAVDLNRASGAGASAARLDHRRRHARRRRRVRRDPGQRHRLEQRPARDHAHGRPLRGERHDRRRSASATGSSTARRTSS